MTSQELRRKYIEFYKSKGHAEIPSASLIPENDPSILFTTAGMSPLVPFLLGEKHPAGTRLVNSQKCVRTGDIDEVGDGFHHTFFEMLGHWSLGDYFKKEAIEMSFDFLTKTLGLPLERLAFTVFEGDENASRDDEAADAWISLGVSKDRLAYLPKKDNWWELAGNSGPCGPCTEMFFWVDEKNPAPAKFDPSDKRWVEIGNDVLMQYEKVGESKYQLAKQKNIDNGTGLERLLTVMSGLDDDYKTDLFWPIIEKIEELSGKKYGADEETTRSMRIIADHIRAACFIIRDGIHPSNLGQGYVLRRLIRIAARYVDSLGIVDSKIYLDLIIAIGNIYKDVYPDLLKNTGDVVMAEVKKFNQTLEKGIKEFNNMSVDGKISGKEAFILFSTYGFPFELTKKLAEEKGFSVDEDEFRQEMQGHSELSRTASAGMFKGGLANQSEQAIKYHTATHLTLAALRKVLGDHVFQRGSNITDERMRLDFSHGEKMTPEQIKEVEALVNEQIQKNLPIECTEMGVDEAKAGGAMGVFENKYGDKVKVYSVGANDVCFSKEICGGPHAKTTGELGTFKILKEEASSSGVRRIKATLS